MDHHYLARVSATPPAPPAAGVLGYPQAGDPLSGALPTVPGAYHHYMIAESLRRVIVNAGLTPDHTDLDLLWDAINAATSGSVTTVNASGSLTAQQIGGLILVDASAGDVLLTLPATSGALGVRDVIVRRLDSSINKVVISGAGTNRVMHNTHLSQTGYTKFALMGAGDWWHLRCDTDGHWWPIGRLDATPIGRIAMATGMVIAPGGWWTPAGLELSRADYPWAWDYAQQAGNLINDADRTADLCGCWTRGDGVTTFRLPEARGEYLITLDESRGVDAGRVIGQARAAYMPPIPRDGWGAAGSGLGTAASGRLITGSGTAELNEGLESLRVASADRTVTATGLHPRDIAYPARLKLI